VSDPGSPTPFRPRRSVHFVPATRPRFLEKALGTAADVLVLDLEDAVPPDGKDAARERVAAWLRDADFGRHEVVVRVNPPGSTPWGAEDLAALHDHPPHLVMVPKVDGPEDLAPIVAALPDRGRLDPVTDGTLPPGLLPVATETPRGALRVTDTAAAPGVRVLTWGAEDLSAALGGQRNRDRRGRYLPLYEHVRHQTLLAAAAAGVCPIDGVYVDHRDRDGLAAEAEEAAWLGFQGKMTIHPDQIEVVNEAFTPSEAVLAEARELLDAFEAARAEGRYAFTFRGAMVDAPHLDRARRQVALAQALGTR
jgi:citrate lyase subunit beta/citryl-CoA lyase